MFLPTNIFSGKKGKNEGKTALIRVANVLIPDIYHASCVESEFHCI